VNFSFLQVSVVVTDVYREYAKKSLSSAEHFKNKYVATGTPAFNIYTDISSTPVKCNLRMSCRIMYVVTDKYKVPGQIPDRPNGCLAAVFPQPKLGK
jgi:hypothetical protein